MELCMINRFFNKWFKDRSGTTAIEFSLVGLPFVLFVIGTIEVCILFLAGSLMEGAVYDASRIIRTGQIQDAADAEDRFNEAICDHAGMLLDCDEFQYDVRVLGSFGEAADQEAQVDEEGNLVDQGFDAGGVSDIIMIRVSYRYPMMTPLIGDIFGTYENNSRLLVATTVFQSEPYQFE